MKPKSLQGRYLLIILLALVLMPITFPLVSVLFHIPFSMQEHDPNLYEDSEGMESMWKKEGEQLGGRTDEEINERLRELKQKYNKASIFWVDGQGSTKLKLPEQIKVPAQWDPLYTIDFMKTNRGLEADPYTVVSFIGSRKSEGFMVIQVPRGEMDTEWEKVSRSYDYYYLIATFAVLGLFLFVSWIFFYRIRQRLLRLQEAMDKPADGGIPLPIAIEKKDEIGQLEGAFNRMIDQLETGRQREREEEELRRQLIANLSHDLRTPLTTIRGHAYSLKKEITSEKGRESLELIDNKVSYLGQLIENLLSYTLLTSGKYPYNPEKTDIVRLVKTSAAAWYPVFENKGFELDIELPDKSIYWDIDGQWMNRILDNLFQNILRHAAQGKYAGVLLDAEKEILLIKDKGPGMTGESAGKGAGIGLSIAALMLKEMDFDLQINSSSGGTEMVIGRKGDSGIGHKDG